MSTKSRSSQYLPPDLKSPVAGGELCQKDLNAQPLVRSGVAVIAVTLMVVFGGMTVAAPPASAETTPGINATPYNAGGEWWYTNGCNFVPEDGPYFDFGHACTHHDGCYEYHWGSQATCDWWFLNDMLASCDAMGEGYACRAQAFAYWYGVREFGLPWYLVHSPDAPVGSSSAIAANYSNLA